MKRAVREVREMYRVHCPNHRWIVTGTKDFNRFFKKRYLKGPLIDLTGENIEPQTVFTGTPELILEVGNLTSHSLLDYLYKNDRFEGEWRKLWEKNPIENIKEEEDSDPAPNPNLRPALGKYQRKRPPVKKVKKVDTPALESFQEKENAPIRRNPARKRKAAEAESRPRLRQKKRLRSSPSSPPR